MQQTILEDKSDYQQALKERDELFSQVQRQNLLLKASLARIEAQRSRGCQLLRLAVGLLLQVGIAIPGEITEYLGGQQ